jgi:hypothetical protein
MEGNDDGEGEQEQVALADITSAGEHVPHPTQTNVSKILFS